MYVSLYILSLSFFISAIFGQDQKTWVNVHFRSEKYCVKIFTWLV